MIVRALIWNIVKKNNALRWTNVQPHNLLQLFSRISVQEETILNQKREISILSTKSKQFQIEISSDKHVSFSRTSDQVGCEIKIKYSILT